MRVVRKLLGWRWECSCGMKGVESVSRKKAELFSGTHVEVFSRWDQLASERDEAQRERRAVQAAMADRVEELADLLTGAYIDCVDDFVSPETNWDWLRETAEWIREQ